MSVEMAGEVGATFSASVAAPATSIGEGISQASSIGSSMGSDFSQSFSGLPTSELPSSISSPIITEISAPVGMEFDSPVEPLVGDFELHDIISKPFATEPTAPTFQTQVEPATFLDPKIVEEINAATDVVTEIQNESAAEPEIFEPSPMVQIQEIVKEAKSELITPLADQLADQSTVKTTIETLLETPTLADQEVGSLATEILTLGAIETTSQPNADPEEIPQIESQSDVQTLKKALSILEMSDFTKEEMAQWKAKLEKAAEPQSIAKIQEGIETQAALETQTAIETETEAKTVEEVENAAAGGLKPPDLPTAQDGQFEQEPEDETEEEEEEPLWDVYHIKDKWKNADEVNKRRAELAAEIAQRAAQKENPRLEAEAEIIKLDAATVEEIPQVLEGKLEKPAVAHKIYAALSVVDPEDSQSVGKIIADTVKRNVSKEAKPTVITQQTVKESELPTGAQKLAQQKATEILWKNNRFQRGRVLFRKPIEIKKVENKKSQQKKAA